MANNEIVFDVMEHIGVISESATGWKKEVNLISWNNGKAKIDIRDWDKDHLHMSKGITLRPNEADTLLALLKGYFEKHRGAAEEALSPAEPQTMAAAEPEAMSAPEPEAMSVPEPETTVNAQPETAQASF